MRESENPKMVNEISLEISSGDNDSLPCRRSGDLPDLPPQKTRKIFIRVNPASSCHRNFIKYYDGLSFCNIRQRFNHSPQPQGADQKQASTSIKLFYPEFGRKIVRVPLAIFSWLCIVMNCHLPGMFADDAVSYFIIGCHGVPVASTPFLTNGLSAKIARSIPNWQPNLFLLIF